MILYAILNISISFILIIRLQGKAKKIIEVTLPINVLVYCTELELTEEEFSKMIADPKLVQSSITFELDTARIPSIQRLNQLFENSNLLKVYKTKEMSKGILYAGTQFAHKNGKTVAFVRVNVADPKNSKVEVSSEKNLFVDSIINDIAKVIRK